MRKCQKFVKSSCRPTFSQLDKTSATTWFRKLLTFSHMISVFFQPNGLYLGLKTQLIWKKTEFMWENVKNLRNHLVDRRFHNETKLAKHSTVHCGISLGGYLALRSKEAPLSKTFWHASIKSLNLMASFFAAAASSQFGKWDYIFQDPLEQNACKLLLIFSGSRYLCILVRHTFCCDAISS